MILEMKVPSPGESISEVEIASWLVKNGDFVTKDQPIAEIDSDKATLELPAEQSGIIEILVEEGSTVKIGQIVCKIDTSAKTNSTTSNKEEIKKTVSAPNNKKEEINPEPVSLSIISNDKNYSTSFPSPAAKKILNEKNISPSQVIGTGKGGRITKEDAIKSIPSMGSNPSNSIRDTNIIKISSLRRKLSERLVHVKNETAMLTTFNEVNMKPIFDLRNEFKDTFKNRHNIGLGFMSFFTLASVRALKMYPEVNSMIDGQNQIKFDYYDISIAVSSPKGLVVPVLRNAQNLNFRGIEMEIKRLADKAKNGQITVDDMTGGTFTITNGGVFGSLLSTPIINPPQSAILGMHNIVERPIAENGQVLIRPMMYIALSYDHRVIDGRESVGTLIAIKEALENPIELLMDNNPTKALEL